MLERGDMPTFHEPFLYLYYVHDAKKRLRHFEADPCHPTSYADIRRAILDAASERPVFVKDMCYYVADYIHDDAPFVRRVKNTFLIRDPAKSIPSYYRLDETVTSEEIGLDAQYRHFELARRLTGEAPVVIDADDLLSDTPGTMRAYCAAIGVDFLPEALSWDEPVPAEWRHVAGWHGDLSHSSGIAASDGTVRRAASGLDAAAHLREYYAHHLPFYRRLREHRLTPTPMR